jgi:flavodoxin I
MAKIGLFYGSDTGCTEEIANKIQELIGEDTIELIDVFDASTDDFEKYDQLILGLSTWYDGQLQSDWESFFDDFKTIDFTGKTVALFGLGDQIGYAHNFTDGVGIIGKEVINNGGTVIGNWPTEGFEHETSINEEACDKEGYFLGLALDEDNQPDLTEERVEAWVNQIKGEFGL